MPCTGNDHSQVIVDAILNAVFIANGATGLYKCADTRCMREFHTIIKREKSITCQDGAFQIKLKVLGFVNSLF